MGLGQLLPKFCGFQSKEVYLRGKNKVPKAPHTVPPAFLACWMDSMVCCITPSSAATTRITMSVTLVPLARMAEKAAWPGVSRKVIFSPEGMCTVNKWYGSKSAFHPALFEVL